MLTAADLLKAYNTYVCRGTALKLKLVAIFDPVIHRI